jgi:hypothetical protein
VDQNSTSLLAFMLEIVYILLVGCVLNSMQNFVLTVRKYLCQSSPSPSATSTLSTFCERFYEFLTGFLLDIVHVVQLRA